MTENLKWPPQYLLPHVHALAWSLSLRRDGICDPLLPIEHSKGNQIQVIMWLRYIRLQHYLAGVSLSLVGFEEANSHAGEVHMTWSYGKSLGAEGSFQQENEALCSATTSKLILSTTPLNLEADSSPVKPSNETPTPVNCPWFAALQRTQLRTQTPDSLKQWDHKCVFFPLTQYVVPFLYINKNWCRSLKHKL